MPHRRRVEIWGEARVNDDPALTKRWATGLRGAARVILFRISAWDAIVRSIPQKFDAADVAEALASRDARITELEAELAALKGAPAPASDSADS
jgi:hypothetical protein